MRFLARFGGDEFTSATPCGPQPKLPRRSPIVLHAALCRGIRRRRPQVAHRAEYRRCDLSGATATMNRRCSSNADAALYRSKADGARADALLRNRHGPAPARAPRACRTNCAPRHQRRTLVHYQPLARDRGAGRRHGSAVPLDNPTRGTDFAGRIFIPLAEESGLIIPDRANGCCARPAAKRHRGRIRSASPSTCRRSSSGTATWSASCMRSCWKPVSRRRGSNSKSPKAC